MLRYVPIGSKEYYMDGIYGMVKVNRSIEIVCIFVILNILLEGLFTFSFPSWIQSKLFITFSQRG